MYGRYTEVESEIYGTLATESRTLRSEYIFAVFRWRTVDYLGLDEFS